MLIERPHREDSVMNASNSYLNGAGTHRGRGERQHRVDDLEMLNTLLKGATSQPPSNPNEVRERPFRKLHKDLNR
jgi:hypothetical protein